ncbi:MAG: polyprenyl synthetase family protein [Ignavibacteria bacterium]|nr:polyprenyl synthetase family protein [Ignavibacteria bacterium]
MSKTNLTDIARPIQGEIKEFADHFRSAMKSKVGLVDLISTYILKQKGKKVRPVLVLLAARACGDVSTRTYRGASLVELLHTATLVHDDVVDSADKRRGFPSINAVWKNKIAVLMGDYLLARGLMIAVEGKDFDFLEKITDTVKRMSEGELLQIQKTRKLDIDEVTYFKVISDKTASLLQTCCVIGAMSASADPELHQALEQYGANLGMAFQIKDDILDYDGKFQLFGKTIGADIKEKKITLPLIFALNSVPEKEAKSIRALIKSKNKDVVSRVIEFVHEHKGIEYAEKVANECADKARLALRPVADSPAKESLLQLVDFVIKREK